MHPDVALRECVTCTGGNLSHAQEIMSTWRAKESAFTSFLGKRGRASEPAVETGYTGAYEKKPATPQFPQHPDHEVITRVFEAITAEDGHLSALFEHPDMAPWLIAYYPGFHAYAMSVRGI